MRSSASPPIVAGPITSWCGLAPAVGLDRDRFAAPDQLRPALPEAPPPPADEIARGSVGLAVPALHREHREPVADRRDTGRPVGEGERLGERAGRVDRVVDAELVLDPERPQAVAQLGQRAQPLHLHDVGVAHAEDPPDPG